MDFDKKWRGMMEWGSKARKETQRLERDPKRLHRQLIEESEAGDVHPSELPCDCEDCNRGEDDGVAEVL